MKNTGLIFGFGFLLSIFIFSNFIQIVSAGSECILRNSAACEAGENPIIRFSQMTNSHAEIIEQNNYVNTICCTDLSIDAGGQCNALGSSSAPLIRLSNMANAHGSVNTITNYKTLICVNNAASCYAEQNTMNCSNGATKVFSLSSLTNAHFSGGTDASYTTKICCQISLGQDIAAWKNLDNVWINNAQINDYVALTYASSTIASRDVSYSIYEGNGNSTGIIIVDDNSTQGISFVKWKIPITMGGKTLYFNATPQGGQAVSSGNLTINATEQNTLPITKIDYPNNGNIYFINKQISFEQSSFDEDDLLTGVWDFGDSQTTNMDDQEIRERVVKNHSYSSGGRKRITFVVTDSRGAKAMDNIDIHIISGGVNVVVNISAPANNAQIVQNQGIVNFSAAGTFSVNVTGTGNPNPTIICIAGNCPLQTSDGFPIIGGAQALEKNFLNFTWSFDGSVPNSTMSKKGDEQGAISFTKNFLLGKYFVNLAVKHDAGNIDGVTNNFTIICTSAGCLPCIGEGCDSEGCAAFTNETICKQNEISTPGFQNDCSGYFYNPCIWRSGTCIESANSSRFEPENPNDISCIESSGECNTAVVNSGVCENGELQVTYEYQWVGIGRPDPSCLDGQQFERIIPCPEEVEIPFFGLWNIISVVMILGIVYTIIILRRRVSIP